MEKSYRQHDISDRVWNLLEPLLPGRAESWGGVAQDNRQFINAIFFGFCALALPGETCRRITEIGKIHTDAFVAGGMRGFGNLFLKNWSMIPILSG